MKTIEEFFLSGEDSIRTHFVQKNYARALELLETEADNYPVYARMLGYKKIQTMAMLGDKAKTLYALQTALDKGICFPKMAFEAYGDESPQIPDFIYNSPEFQHMIDAHQKAWQHMLDTTEPSHATATPDSVEQPPLVVGFHGNTSSIVLEFPKYQPLADLGYRVVMPQSAQEWAQDRYVWGDWKNTEKQVGREWQLIQEKYTFAPTEVVTAGMSKGGEVAVWAAMSGTIPAKGVITIGMGGPHIDEPERLEPLVTPTRERNILFYFLVGTEDLTLPAVQKTSDYLKQQGLRVHLEIVEGLGHVFPPDMVTFWNNALTFIKA